MSNYIYKRNKTFFRVTSCRDGNLALSWFPFDFTGNFYRFIQKDEKIFLLFPVFCTGLRENGHSSMISFGEILRILRKQAYIVAS